MIDAARSCRISRGRPVSTAVTALSAIIAVCSNAVDPGCRQIAAGAGIEYEIERIGRALGLPEAIGHDAHRVVSRALRRAGMLRARLFVGDMDRRQADDGAHARQLQDLGSRCGWR